MDARAAVVFACKYNSYWSIAVLHVHKIRPSPQAVTTKQHECALSFSFFFGKFIQCCCVIKEQTAITNPLHFKHLSIARHVTVYPTT